jgi:hypothetical protein
VLHVTLELLNVLPEFQSCGVHVADRKYFPLPGVAARAHCNDDNYVFYAMTLHNALNTIPEHAIRLTVSSYSRQYSLQYQVSSKCTEKVVDVKECALTDNVHSQSTQLRCCPRIEAK